MKRRGPKNLHPTDILPLHSVKGQNDNKGGQAGKYPPSPGGRELEVGGKFTLTPTLSLEGRGG
ncbi:MAG: hypothetical protein WBC82_01730 [Dehalococcoidia bacterium]